MTQENMHLPKLKIALIVTNFVVFAFVLAVNYQSRNVSALFPKQTGKVSDENPTEVTPASSTFAIWAFIYVYQTAWVIYSLTLIFRKAPDILPNWFFVCYMFANLGNFLWLLIWSRENLYVAFAIIVPTAIALATSLYFAYTGLLEYLKGFPKEHEMPNIADVWCIRLLVQNGIIFYNTWVFIASCLNLAITLTYDIEMNGSKAATISLVVLLVLIIIWFVLENFIFEKYTRFTFAEYIVLIVGLSGILKKHWTDGSGNQGFVLFLLVLSSVLFITRIIIIIIKERRGLKSEGFKLIIRD